MARFTYESLLRQCGIITLITLLLSFLLLPKDLPLRLNNELLTSLKNEYEFVESDKVMEQWKAWAFDNNRSEILPYLPKMAAKTFLDYTHETSLTEILNDMRDASAGPVFLASSMMVMILTSLWASFVEDKEYILKEHLELVHYPDSLLSREHLNKQYWKGVEKSGACNALAFFLFPMRLSLCFYCTVILREEAIYCLVRHGIMLVLICFRLPQNYRYLTIPIKVYYDILPHKDRTRPLKWLHLFDTKLAHWLVEWQLARIVSKVRKSRGVNDFPCTICDSRWPDIWIAAVPPDQVKLAEHQGEHCTHCWENWAVGDIATVFGCGHVFHTHCNDPWFQTKGAQVCSMCTFQVKVGEGDRAPRRKIYSEAEVSRLRDERSRREGRLFS